MQNSSFLGHHSIAISDGLLKINLGNQYLIPSLLVLENVRVFTTKFGSQLSECQNICIFVAGVRLGVGGLWLWEEWKYWKLKSVRHGVENLKSGKSW